MPNYFINESSQCILDIKGEVEGLRLAGGALLTRLYRRLLSDILCSGPIG